MPSRVLILGGGFGGMFAARHLSRLPPGRVAVELVDDNNYFVFQPLLPEVAAGTLNPSDAVTPFRVLLPEIKVTEGEIIGIDLDARRVDVVQSQRRQVRAIPYDHLVLAVGTRVDLSRFPGLSEHGLLMKDLADAFALRNHVIDCLEQADCTEDLDLKRRMLTFVTIGAGLSGIETIGEIEDMIRRALPFYPRIRRPEIRLVLAEHMGRVMPELPDRLAGYALRALGRRGIEVMTGAGVRSASAEAVELENGTIISALTKVVTIGNAPQPLIDGLNLPKERGRVRTEPTLRVQGTDNVWALGDCAWIPLEAGEFAAAPPTAQAAAQEAGALAHNMAVSISGHGTLRPFVYRSRGLLASLGGRRGIAEIWGRQVTGRMAWLFWRIAYLSMLPGLAFKVRVAFDWLLDMAFPRNLVQIRQHRRGTVHRARFRAGEVVFRQGDFAGPIFVVESGRFQRSPDLADGRAMVGPGGHFGEACMKGETLRRTTVRAVEDSTCLVIERHDFDALATCLQGLKPYVEQRRHGPSA